MLRRARISVVAAALVVSMAACGSDDTPVVAESDKPTDHSTMDHEEKNADPQLDAAEPDAGNVVEVSFANGKVTGPTKKVQIPLGEEVTFKVTSDVEEELHVHGYDKTADLAPGKESKVTFTADIPGGFEAELEGSGTLLFEFEVK